MDYKMSCISTGSQVLSVPLMVGPGAYAVTGGTGALGLCVSRRLVEEGAKVRPEPLIWRPELTHQF